MAESANNDMEEAGQTSGQLPSFQNPPVIETVFCIQFEPLSRFTTAHLGAFWEAIGGRQEWPEVAEAPAVESVFERFGKERLWIPLNSMRVFGPMLAARVQLSRGDRMVQIQNSRLMYNWLGSSGTIYPRYSVLRPEFDSLFSRFKTFVADHALGSIQPNQWEITYINHLAHGTIWNKPGDWNKVFNASAMLPTSVGDIVLDDFSGKWSYEIPDKRGRLHAKLTHGFGAPGGRELLILDLTARGPISEGEGSSSGPEDGLDLGRRIIVNSFQQLTSSDARSYWEEQL